jgi:hypothetical protein
MKNKLQSNEDHFPTESSKVAYIYGRMKNDAAILLCPHLQGDYSDITPKDIFAILDAAYIDSYRELYTREEYGYLLMKTSIFQEFYTQFLRLAHEAKIPENQRKDDMISKLSFNLQKLILLIRLSIRTLTDLVSTCQFIDSEIRALDLRIGNRKPSTRSGTPTAISRTIPTTNMNTPGTRNTISSKPRNNL